MASSANNIVINPVNVYWQIEASEQIDMGGLVAANLDAKYFLINSAKDATEYYVWFDLDASSSDPAPAGKTGIEINVATGDSPSVMATAMQVAIDALGDYVASVSGAVVTVERPLGSVGEVTDTVDVDSGVSITICRRGKDFDLGLLEGDVEITNAPANFEITAHQTGITKLGIINQGIESLECQTVLQETTKSKLKEMYKIYGGEFTPVAGTEVFGVGTSAVGKNMLVEAARLVFSPVNSLGSELSYQTNFMLAVPVPSGLVYSGENPRTLTVDWKGFPDLSKDSRVNALLVGNPEQSGI